MGAQLQTKLIRGIQSSAKGRFFAEVETLKTHRVGPNNRVETEIQPYLLVSLYNRREPTRVLATVRVESLPGCCGVIVMHHFTGTTPDVLQLVDIAFRGAQFTGYGMVLLTLRHDSPIVHELETSGWDSQSFLNGKTDNTISMVFKTIPQVAKVARPALATEGE